MYANESSCRMFRQFFSFTLSLSLYVIPSLFFFCLSLPSNWLKNWFRVLSLKTSCFHGPRLKKNRTKPVKKYAQNFAREKRKVFHLNLKETKVFFALFFFVTMSPYVQRCVQDVAPLSKTANTKKNTKFLFLRIN